MKKSLILAALIAFPMIASAQTINRIGDIITWVGDMLNRIIPILITIALIVFFWGLIQYIKDRKHKGGRDIMIAGLIGLFVMVSVWGIIRIAQNTFGVRNSGTNIGTEIPQVPFQRGNGGYAPYTPSTPSGNYNTYGPGSNPNDGVWPL